MPGRVEQRQLAAAQPQGRTVRRLHDAIDRHRQDLAIERAGTVCSVDFVGGCYQLRRVGHVSRTARMHDQPRLRQLAHQQARTSRVIEVDMGQDNVLDHGAGNAQGIERAQDNGGRGIGGGIDQRRTPFADDEVYGIVNRLDIARIDDMDIVFVPLGAVHRSSHAGPGQPVSHG